MEGNLSAGNMIPSSSYGVLMEGSMHGLHQQQQHPHGLHQHHSQQGSMVHPPMHDVFPLTVGSLHDCEQPMSVVDYNKGERAKASMSDEDEPSFNEGGIDGHGEGGRGKKGSSQWQRMKWTDTMVKLLITVVSYIGEDVASECSSGGRRKFAILQKKGKWKSVSKVMAERGYFVSPQQCEDKFNDLNKRYKRLTDILGRGTSCKVVENPALMDMMDHLSEKAKETVRKILSSKHLFYEEMCSYHNGNRLHLPPDPALQRSLQLALRSREEDEMRDTRRHRQDDLCDDEDVDSDDHDDEDEENHALHGDDGAVFGFQGVFPKRMKHGHDHEEVTFGNLTPDCDKRSYSQPQNAPVDMNQVIPDGNKAAWLQKEWIRSRSLQLEEQKLQIQEQMLELEKQRFKWQRFSRKKDRELDKLRMENERMKLENERMTLELKRKELESGYN
ncbi:hypothetical protein ACHQM5_016842 [Ranunculus cassubicifolius]